LMVVGAVLYWLGVIVAMHVLEPEFSPIRVPMSAYVSGAYGGWMTSSFFALAIALFAAALGLVTALRRNLLTWAAFLFFFIAALGVALGGLFPGVIHRPSSLHLHAIGSVLAFPSMTIGTFLFSVSLCFDRRRISIATLILATGMLIIHLLRFTRPIPDTAGLMQRIFFLLFVPWLILIGLHLISACHSKALTRSSTE
jgi:hypothetical protein